MAITHGAKFIVHLPLGEKPPARLDAQIRNAIQGFMEITCPVHTQNTSLEATVTERAADHFLVEIEACCEACARRGERALFMSTSTA